MKLNFFRAWKLHSMRFLIGGGTYLLIEVVWRMLYHRRATHPIMMLPAGTVLTVVCYLDDRKWNIFLNALIGMLIVVFFELVIGLTAIHVFDTYLWDYGSIPGTFMHVICPRWSMIWYGMCFGVILIKRMGTKFLRKRRERTDASSQ